MAFSSIKLRNVFVSLQPSRRDVKVHQSSSRSGKSVVSSCQRGAEDVLSDTLHKSMVWRVQSIDEGI